MGCCQSSPGTTPSPVSAKVVSTSASSASALQAPPVSQTELLAVHDRQGHGRQLRTVVMSGEIRKLTYFPELNPQPWQVAANLQTFITDHFPTVSAVLNLFSAVLHLLFSSLRVVRPRAMLAKRCRLEPASACLRMQMGAGLPAVTWEMDTYSPTDMQSLMAHSSLLLTNCRLSLGMDCQRVNL